MATSDAEPPRVPAPPAVTPPAPRHRGKAARYLGSTKNIVGSMGALGGLALFFTGVIGAPVWPLVVAGLYGIGALIAPPERPVDLRSEMDTKDLDRSLDRLLRKIEGRVPKDLESKVRHIAATIRTILPRTGQLAPGSQELFILQRTITDYLPTSLESFMNLPRSYATLRPLKGTKTAQQVLSDQLDLLQDQMNEVADAAAKSDADRLLAQGRFLEERFGRTDLSIGPKDDAPDAGTAPAAP